MTAAPALELEGIRRAYGPVVAVDGVTLAVARGEFVTLLGPSGSGKTTTLRLVGGFERPDSGAIRINGERIDHQPPYARDTATIFQSGALFPHKTVAENVAFGLKMRGLSGAEMADRIQQSLAMVRLSGYEDRYPIQLSGGQKQRVALARSMAVRPAILLFDEPLSALDLALRLQLRGEIKRLHDELGFTAIYVTHDQGEAMAMSSRVAVMNKGCIEQIDAPDRIFNAPQNEFVYTFIGESCCLPVHLNGAGAADRAGKPLRLDLAKRPGEGDWRLYVRPTRLRLQDAARACDNRLEATVHFIEFLGEVNRYHLKAEGIELFCDSQARAGVDTGQTVTVGWQSADMRAFQ